MSVTNDLTLINDISNFKLGHGVTFVCDVSSLISTYNNFKLYSVDNNDELTELVDVSDNITNGLLVYKYYPQSSGSLNIVLGTEEVSDTIHRSNTIQLRINNNSHAENIFNANAALVANLTSMGVLGASTNDGLATNIAKVTSIPPTQRGIELDTSITCFAPATASVGVPFNITGVLTSSYDDTSQANVDMHGGEIQGATIEIYNGNTLLGTCTTNIDGEYTFTYTPLSTGTLSIKAVYDSANDFYEDSASNSNSVSVHVAVSSVTLTTDKNILSYVDNEYATLTATVLDSNDDPIVGETVSFDIVDPDTGEVLENIDSATTDSNGVCSVYYYSNHTNSLYIRAICNGILSTQTYIEDIYKYVTDFSNWETKTKNVDTFKFSDFELPSNHRIEVKFKNTNGGDIVLGDTEHQRKVGNNYYWEWSYAWYINISSLYRLYYSTGYQAEVYHNESNTINTTSIYAIEVDGTSLKTYRDTIELSSVNYTDPYGLTRLIRISDNHWNNIDWIKIRQL